MFVLLEDSVTFYWVLPFLMEIQPFGRWPRANVKNWGNSLPSSRDQAAVSAR